MSNARRNNPRTAQQNTIRQQQRIIQSVRRTIRSGISARSRRDQARHRRQSEILEFIEGAYRRSHVEAYVELWLEKQKSPTGSALAIKHFLTYLLPGDNDGFNWHTGPLRLKTVLALLKDLALYYDEEPSAVQIYGAQYPGISLAFFPYAMISTDHLAAKEFAHHHGLFPVELPGLSEKFVRYWHGWQAEMRDLANGVVRDHVGRALPHPRGCVDPSTLRKASPQAILQRP